MKKIFLLLAGLSLFLFNCGGSENATSAGEEQAVIAAFDGYKTAVLADKGEEATKFVDTRTIKYYETILGHIKNSDSATVDNLKLMDKLVVFAIRHLTPKDSIMNFDGKGLFVHAIQQGMVGKDNIPGMKIGEVSIDKEFASGRIEVEGKPTPASFHFYKENGQWRMDLTSIFSISEIAFNSMIKQSGQEPNEFLFATLEMMTGKAPGNNIWQPVAK